MPPPKNKPEQSDSKNFTTTGVRVLTGTVDLAIKCRKLKNPLDLLLEIFGKPFAYQLTEDNSLHKLSATVVATKPGDVPCETILLLRNVKNGPVIQISYYGIDVRLPETLKNVRCLCRITCLGRIQALKVQELQSYNTALIQRLLAISSHTLKMIVAKEQNEEQNEKQNQNQNKK